MTSISASILITRGAGYIGSQFAFGCIEAGRDRGAARETVRRECDLDVIAGARLAAYRRAIADFAQSPQSPVDGWIGAVCRPNAATEDVDEFLGQFPIRSLTRHVARRLRERTLAPLRTRRP